MPAPTSRGRQFNAARLLLFLGLPGMARSDSAVATTATETENAQSFLLRVVQPGLAGLMDGSVSTLAPIFATAFATHRPMTAFLVGMAAATGAGISMAFAEALSDDGKVTGRGHPVTRGVITGAMTFLGGALHTLPFLMADLHTALLVAYVVVAVELSVIAAIRHRFFGTNWGLSIAQVVGGGALVFLAAIIFGNARGCTSAGARRTGCRQPANETGCEERDDGRATVDHHSPLQQRLAGAVRGAGGAVGRRGRRPGDPH